MSNEELDELENKKKSIEDKRYYDHNLRRVIELSEEDKIRVKELNYEIKKRGFCL